MPRYRYGVLQGGERREGVLDAESERAAADQLRREGATVLSLAAAAAESGGSGGERFRLAAERLAVRSQSVEVALRQLGTLLHSGVPILTALKALSRTAPSPLGRALDRIAEGVREGKPFSRSVALHLPGIDRVTVGLLAVGESNGTLDRMAVQAANVKERARKMREQVLQAFGYPAFVMLAAMGVGTYMVREVFPVVMKFIATSRQSLELPLPTRMVIGLDHFLGAYGAYLLLAPTVAAAGVAALRRSARSGALVDALALRIPLLGGAFRFHANASWCTTLGSLLGSGLDVLAAVDLVRGTMGNWHYAAQFDKVRAMLREGYSLSRSLEATELRRLTPMAHALVDVGEEGGHLDENLLEVARFSEDQLGRRVALLGKMMEPAVFIVVGAFVGLVYFGFFLAMLTAAQAAR
jgi:type II secretory pathway component PulF